MTPPTLPTIGVHIQITADHSITFAFDPRTVLLPDAYRIRPQVDSAIRALRMVGMFLDALIEQDTPRRARERTTDIALEEGGSR